MWTPNLGRITYPFLTFTCNYLFARMDVKLIGRMNDHLITGNIVDILMQKAYPIWFMAIAMTQNWGNGF